MLPIILASQSPRRRQLLEWAEVPFTVLVKPTEETFPPGLSPADAAVHIAAAKADAVADQATGRTVLAADTIVVLDGEIIGKPRDADHAVAILKKLSGNTHTVITGVVIRTPDREIRFADQTEVGFHPLTTEQLRYYVEKYRPYDKAGAYAIQEWIGVVGIQRVHGDFYNVMGLPVSRVVQALKEISG
jgi:septum formation protein